MEIRKLLEKLGHKNLLSSDWYSTIDLWLNWYGGKAKFHEYRIYNGQRFVPCTRKTLSMAKKVSEDKADLLLNEKVEITVTPRTSSDKQSTSNTLQEYLDTVLMANNFWVRGNQLVELANALGTGAFVEFMDGEDVCIDYVPAPCIWPLRWSNGRIVDCAFASRLSTGENEQTYINRHVLEGSRYVVYNYLYDKEGKELPLPENVLPVWDTKSEAPLFQIITPNIVNNIDIANPMGISVYANSIDDLETIDLAYDSFYNEFKLGRKRIFLKEDMVKLPDPRTGEQAPVFDPNDTVFYMLPGETADKMLTESNMELRVEEHIRAIQTGLDILSDKCGFGKGFYKFEVDGVVKTATEVVSQHSKLFRRIKKDEIILEKALKDLVRAVLFLGGKSTDVEISISFDDSIIEDTNAKANRAMLERTAGIIDDVEYFMETRDLEEKAAQELVEKIRARRPPEPSPPDLFGGGA